MKLCHFIFGDQAHWGALREDNIIFRIPENEDLDSATSEVKLRDAVEISKVKLLSPVSPTKIVCVGRNYAEHAAELGNEVPKEPLLFLKAPSALIVHGEEIVLPAQSKQVEHEGELGVVIAKDCAKLTEKDDPFEYVLGYCCVNDVTARDIQRKDVQFTRGKSFDTFFPVSFFIETELDVSDIRVITRVNGEIKQDARTSQMVFPVDYLIRYISNQMTLKSGDIIATGTPSGVSQLRGGDVCEVEIEGLGTLGNPVVNF